MQIFALSTALLFTSGCNKVKFTDNEWCADEGRLGADCFFTLSDKSETLSKADWDNKRFGQLCTDIDSFTNWKKGIEKLCANNPDCDPQTKAQFEKFFNKIKSMREHLLTLENRP